MSEVIVNSQKALEDYKSFLDAQFKKHGYIRISMKTGKQRSLTQNRCLHLFCTQLAEALNDAGYDFREFVREGYAVPWTPELVKDHIWRTIQKAVTGRDSTTKPERHEYALIYDVVNQKMIEKGLFVPWPSKEAQQSKGKP